MAVSPRQIRSTHPQPITAGTINLATNGLAGNQSITVGTQATTPGTAVNMTVNSTTGTATIVNFGAVSLSNSNVGGNFMLTTQEDSWAQARLKSPMPAPAKFRLAASCSSPLIRMA